MSESAISAKSARRIFANFVKFVKPIFGTTRRSEGSVMEAEYPTNYQRISNLSLTIRPFRVAILAVLLVFVGSWNSEVWGAWSGSGEGTLENGVWYVLYQTEGSSINTTGSKDYSLLGPGAKLTFDAKRTAKGLGDLEVTQNSGTSQLYKGNPGKVTATGWFGVEKTVDYASYGAYNVDVNTNKITFSFGGTLVRYFKNIKVTMAQYLENPSKSNLNFGEADINSDDATMTFTVAWCNLPAMTYSITGTDKDLFYVSSVANNSAVGKYNTATFTVKYKHTTAGSHSATLTIKDGNGNNTKTVNLTGRTNKLQPTVTWSPDDAMFNVDDVLSATNNNNLTVTLSGDANYVSCSGNSATMLAATSGTITITAHVTGDNIYADRDITKDITITNLEKQYITWTQDFSRLKTTDASKSIVLNATASSGLPVAYELVGDKTGLTLTQSGNTWTLTYSATECKNTTILAKQAGDGTTYAPASSVSLPVKVVDPTKVCDMNEVLINSSISLKAENLWTPASVTYNIDIPASMTVAFSRMKTGFLDAYLLGVDVEFYSGRNGSGDLLYTKEYSASDINTSLSNSNINLSSYINAKSVKITTSATNGYYINAVSYAHRKYCTLSANTVAFETFPNTETSAKTFKVNYANYPVYLECSNNKFSFTPTEFGDCSEYGTQEISVKYTAGNDEGEDVGYLYVKDNTGVTLQTCTLTVVVSKVSQSITSTNIQSSYWTTDKVTLSAEANSELTDFTYSASPTGIATIAGSEMTFSKSGTIAITVNQAGNNIYKPTSTTVSNVEVKKSTPDIATAPTGTSIKYLQTLNKSTLSGGAADITLRGVAHTPVAGSFAWTEPTHVVMDGAGTHEYSVTFTPTDGGMYTTKEFTIPITILRAEQTLAMNNGEVRVAVGGIDAGKSDSYIDLDDLIDSQTGDVVSNVKRDGNVTYEVISENKGNASIGEGNIFSATVCGTYTIRATKAQTDWYDVVTDEFTVTVVKRGNTLATTPAYTQYVDDVISTVATTINSDGTIHTSSSDATIAYYDENQNKIFIPNSEAKSFPSTTVTIKIWQDATDCFEGITEANAKTITLTVKKYDNPFACSWGSFEKTVNFDEVVSVKLTAQNTDYTHSSIAITQSSGEKIATLVRNDDTNNTITASHSVGDAIWHIKQPENYKFKAAEADLTLKVKVIDNEECYMFEDNTEHEFTTKITDGSGHFDNPIAVSGPVNKLYFEAKRDILAVSKFIVQYSVDNGSNWRTFEQQPDLSIFYEEFGPYEFTGLQANEHVSHIRFGASVGGTLSKYYKNIKISRTTNIQPLDANGNHIKTLTMPQSTVDGSTTAQFYLNYSSCDDVIKIVSDNAHFTVDQSEISVDHSKDFNKATITVTYHSSEKDTHTGTITIYTKYQNETLTVTGKTDKKKQTLTWEKGYTESTLSLPVGLEVNNVNYAVSASSGNAVIYTTDNDQVIEIIQAGLGFKIIGEGTATLTATQAGNEDWFPVSDSKIIKATYKKLQEIVWTQDFIRNMEVGVEKPLEAKVYIRNLKTGALTYNAFQTALITYSCPPNTVIALDGDNKKITVQGYGQTSITASLPTGSEYYEDATPVTLIVKVRKPSDGCETPWVLDQSSTVSLFEDKVLSGAAYNFSDWTTPELTSDPIILNPENGKPGTLSYQHDAEIYTIRNGGLLKFCSGTVVAQQRVNGIWQDIEGSEYTSSATTWNWAAGAYEWREVKDLQLEETADAIRFRRLTGGTGHHNFKDIQISLLHYLRPTTAEVDLGDITIGEDRLATVGFDYSDIKKDLSVAKGNEEDKTFSLGESTVYVACGTFGHYDLPITVHPTELGEWSNTVIVTDKFTGEEVTIVVKANVVPEFIHTYETAGEWGEQTHWKDNEKPTFKDDVRINADVTIVSDITVNAITIESDKTVTVNPGVTLTLRDGVSRPRTVYGNLHVKSGAKVNVGTGAFMINDFILDAALGNPGTPASSGQLLDEYAKFIVNGDAYFQLTLGNTNTIGWYDFVVPFNVDVTSGISIVDKDGNVLPARHGEDYVVMRYSEAKRAERGKDWIKFNGTMQAGRVYTIAVDANHSEWNTVLFKKNKGAALGASATYEAECSTGEAIDCGWNGLGNGTLQHMKLSDASVKIQVYDHTNNVFETRDDISGNKFAVGTSFFLQVDEDKKPISFVTAEAALPFLAPARERRTTDEFRLALTAENADSPSDRLWVSASEEATGEYVVGHDLLKMGTPSEAKVAQMWAKNEANRLCDIEMPLATSKAKCELGIFAPQEANYTLSVEKMPDDAMLYLTYNGRPVWNLTYAPYTFDLTQGFTEGYGLQISVTNAPQVTTGVDEVQGDDVRNTKVIIDNKMFVITPQGAMYDATGKKIQ